MYHRGEKKQNNLRFYIASLISLNSIATCNNFESLLMSYRFRTHLAAIISLYGDYSTILWFRDKEIFMDQLQLCENAARRGDLILFKSFMIEFDGDIYDIHELLHNACTAAAKFGRKNILEFLSFLRSSGYSSSRLIHTIYSMMKRRLKLKWIYLLLQMIFVI
jgi:hypothetical protein